VCGFSPANVAKLDIAKIKQPKLWGWRFIALDLIFPNSQLVEVYIVFASLELAKKQPPRGPQLEGRWRTSSLFNRTAHKAESSSTGDIEYDHISNHEIFELWRTRDCSDEGLPPGSADRAKYERAIAISNQRYEAAWRVVEERTSVQEMEAFWGTFQQQKAQGLLATDRISLTAKSKISVL
jgi:hypothetical protein